MPICSIHLDLCIFTGDQLFQRVYHNPSVKSASTPASTSGAVRREQPQESGADKRRRKRPCDWWVVGSQVEEVSPLPPPQQLKPVKGGKKVRQNKALGLGSPRNGNVAVSSKPLGGAPGPSRKVKAASAREAVKRSLAPVMDSFPTAAESPSKAGSEVTGVSRQQEVSERRDGSPRRLPEAPDASGADASEANGVWGSQNNRNHSDNT